MDVNFNNDIALNILAGPAFPHFRERRPTPRIRDSA